MQSILKNRSDPASIRKRKKKEGKEPEENADADQMNGNGNNAALHNSLHGSENWENSSRYDTNPYDIGKLGDDGRLPRLVPRGLGTQSTNTVSICYQGGRDIWKLRLHDWYHTFLRRGTVASIVFLLSVWTAMILVFACAYVAIDTGNSKFCGLGKGDAPIKFGPAFAFSLETCTTVGYGLPNGSNAYFNNCEGLQLVIYLQMVWSMLFNAFFIAMMFARLGRSETRGAQVLASKKALVSVSSSGQVRFQLRLFDIDAQYPVIEAHVRLYAVRKDRPVPRPIRILQPNDDLGSVLFLSLPYVVMHHIDIYSLLHPYTPQSDLASGLILRQVDSVTCNRDDVICPVCGESFGTHERWVRHARYQRIVEHQESYPTMGTHLSLTKQDLLPPANPISDIADLQSFFQQEIAEVICVVEGIDPLTSGTFQSLQSYKFEDIVWDEDTQFAPCLKVSNGKIVVDLDRFHDYNKVNKAEKHGNESTITPAMGTPSLRAHDSIYHSTDDITEDLNLALTKA